MRQTNSSYGGNDKEYQKVHKKESRKNPEIVEKEKQNAELRKKNKKIQKEINSIASMYQNDLNDLFRVDTLYASQEANIDPNCQHSTYKATRSRSLDTDNLNKLYHKFTDKSVKNCNGHNFKQLWTKTQSKINKLIENSMHHCFVCDAK